MNIAAWIHPAVEMRPSPIAGMGMFARRTILAGEIVIIWGGVVFSLQEIQAGKADPDTIAVLDEGLYLADPCDAPTQDDYSLTHSCDPNRWMQDDRTLAARREIPPGKELTADYALWLYGVEWSLDPCRCGSGLCRGRVTAQDWQLPELQSRYAGHFTPLINRLILQMSSQTPFSRREACES